MSQYSSGKHADVIAREGLPIYRPLTNPMNPILEDVRLQEPHMVDAQIRYWMGSVPTHVVATLPEGYWYTAAHLKHARTVLTRLAKFKEATS